MLSVAGMNSNTPATAYISLLFLWTDSPAQLCTTPPFFSSGFTQGFFAHEHSTLFSLQQTNFAIAMFFGSLSNAFVVYIVALAILAEANPAFKAPRR